MLNDSGEVLSFRTFGGVTDETLQNLTVVGRNLAKRVFYLINHKLLACCVCSESFCPYRLKLSMNRKLLISFIAAGAAAGLYHLYNLNEFKKYSASKLKDEQEAKKKAEYQKFLMERRRKRYAEQRIA